MSKKVYLDYNATTPLAPEVINCISQTMKENWGNPSSNYETGRVAKETVDGARKSVAAVIGAKASDIIFTSGGTESNNMVIDTALKYFTTWKTNGKYPEMSKPHFVTTNVEHPAISLPLKHLQEQDSAEVSFVPVTTPHGSINPHSIKETIRPSTCLVTVIMANNETGVIMPIAKISRIVHGLNKSRKEQGLCPILLHTDAAQAIGKIQVDVTDLAVDYLTVVGHKFYGPRIGALYVRNLGENGGTPLQPMFFGGGQERGFRPGTENTPMIAGLGKASELVFKSLQIYQEKMAITRNYLEEQLQATFPGQVQFNCKTDSGERLPNTCSVSFVGNGLCGYRILEKCQLVEASCGAACHSHGNEPSAVLLASGVSVLAATNTLRLSVGRGTTHEDVDLVVNDLQQAVNCLRK